MKTTKMIAACALTALLLSGCGTNTAAPSASSSASAAPAASTTSPAADQAKPQNGAPGSAANSNQRTMMMTFQSLIMMDKSTGLAITKDQAAKMLPVVQEAVTKSELSTDAQTNLLAPLTADQKKFIEEAQAKSKQRANGQGGANGGQAGQPPQGDQAGGQAAAGQGQDGRDSVLRVMQLTKRVPILQAMQMVKAGSVLKAAISGNSSLSCCKPKPNKMGS
ncbi:hypothetical protein OB236_05730 [Paenibacillus sp. WQ 127069]|uniref:Uncharacterized protein n=1 Tax=Paenibacillus baimaensis TaxID=2982185 RepID=A0ABT2UAF8_9BACL|nr:hypothetical protein [Paenibacillus sp. WQ 127069]MCU6791626.1 hypothetical protein [Paenibacillus sp. WQ 127069]